MQANPCCFAFIMKCAPLPWLGAMLALAGLPAGAAPSDPAILRSEFIYEPGPVPSVHASTIAETSGGDLAAAWFGGTAERNPDVCIWVSRYHDGHWTTAANVANGLQVGGKRYATWNPVLFQAPKGPLLLFYKVGPSPSEWWGMLMRSMDRGAQLDRPGPAASWNPGSDQGQAPAAGGWDAPLRLEHRRQRARPPGSL